MVLSWRTTRVTWFRCVGRPIARASRHQHRPSVPGKKRSYLIGLQLPWWEVLLNWISYWNCNSSCVRLNVCSSNRQYFPQDFNRTLSLIFFATKDTVHIQCLAGSFKWPWPVLMVIRCCTLSWSKFVQALSMFYPESSFTTLSILTWKPSNVLYCWPVAVIETNNWSFAASCHPAVPSETAHTQTRTQCMLTIWMIWQSSMVSWQQAALPLTDLPAQLTKFRKKKHYISQLFFWSINFLFVVSK